LIFLPDIFRAAVQALPRQVRVERRRFRRKSIVLALLLNVLWILFSGLWMAVGWAIAGVLMAITIIGLPWTRGCIHHRGLHAVAVWPKGRFARRIFRPGRPRHRTASIDTERLGNVAGCIYSFINYDRAPMSGYRVGSNLP